MSWLAPSSPDSLATLAARRLLLGLLFSLGAAQGSPGAEPADRRTAGDLTVFLTLVPSRMVDDDRHREEVRDVHGRVPAWGNPYHVIASVFDAKSGQRLEHVEVRASVFSRESRLAGPQNRLEPMVMKGQKSWGRFFSLPAAAPFRVRLDIRRQPDGPAVTVEFRYKQRPHFELPVK